MAEPRKTLAARRRRVEKQRESGFGASSIYLADQMRRDPPGQWTDNRLEQAQHYRGVIYIAIRAMMDAVLSSTIQINKKHRKYHATNLLMLEKALPTAHAHSEDEQFRPFDDPDHTLVKLVDQPNRTETFNELLAQLVMQYQLTGSGLMWANPNSLGVPGELYVLPTALCYAQPPTADYPEGWWRVTQYYPSGGYGLLPSPIAGGGVPVDARDVFPFKNPHPLWRWDAMSPLTAGGVQLDILESIDMARKSAMEMGLTPDMVLLAPGVNQTQLDVYLEKLKQTNIGHRNHRKVMAIGGDQGDSKFDVKFPSTTAKDMDFSGGWEQMTAYALALFGVPKSVAGLATTGSYAELYAALKQFHTLTLRPLVARLGVWLTRHLARIWSRDLAIQVDLPTIDDQQLQEQQLGVDLAHDGLTYNEYRAIRGRRPVPGGDVLCSVYVAAQQQKAQAQQQAQQPQQPPQPGAVQQVPQPGCDQQPPQAGGESQPFSPNDSASAGAGGPQAADAGGDQLSQLLGTPDAGGQPGEAQGDDAHVQNSVTEAALAALGVPPQQGGQVQKAYEPAHLKARAPNPKTGAPKVPGRTVQQPTHEPTAAGSRTPGGSDTITKTEQSNREPGEVYPAPQTGATRQQTAADTSAPAPAPKPAPNPAAEQAPTAPLKPTKPAAQPAPQPTPTQAAPQSAAPQQGYATVPAGVPNPGPVQHRQEGETWKGPSGHWFKLQNSKPVPTKGPAQAKVPLPGDVRANPLSVSDLIDRGAHNDLHPGQLEAAGAAVAGPQGYSRLPGPNGTDFSVRNGADLKRFLDAGGRLPKFARDRLESQVGQMPAVDPTFSPNAQQKPLPVPGSQEDPLPLPRPVARPVVTRDEVHESVRSGAPIPAQKFASAAAAVPVAPQAAPVLASAHQWASSQAGRHTDAVAAHFGIAPAQAHELLTRAIVAVAQHAAAKAVGGGDSGGVSATISRPATGQSATLKFNPRTVAARQTVNDMAEHLRGGHELTPQHAAEMAAGLEHLPPDEVKQVANAVLSSTTRADAKEVDSLITMAKKATAGVTAAAVAASPLGDSGAAAPQGADPLPPNPPAIVAPAPTRPGADPLAPPQPASPPTVQQQNPESQLPPVPPGHVRLFHGGSDPASGGPRWVTPNADYARHFRSNGGTNELHYADVPESHPAVKEQLDAAEHATGARHSRYMNSFEAPEDIAKALKPAAGGPRASAIPSAPSGWKPGDKLAPDFEVSKGLSPDQLWHEQFSQKYARDHYEDIKAKYLAENGTPDAAGGHSSVVLNTDEWRHHLPGYTGTNAGAVHEAASWLNKKLYAETLQKQKGKGSNQFLVLAGGGGSGKGTLTKSFFDQAKIPVVLDQVSGALPKLEKAIDEAKNNGYKPVYAFVDRDPEAAFAQGVVPRALNLAKKGQLPRTVAVERAVADNLAAREVALQLIQKRPEMTPHIMTMQDGKPRLITDRAEAVEFLKGRIADAKRAVDGGLVERMVADVRSRHAAGEIPENVASGLIGRDNLKTVAYNNTGGENAKPRVPRPEAVAAVDSAGPEPSAATDAGRVRSRPTQGPGRPEPIGEGSVDGDQRKNRRLGKRESTAAELISRANAAIGRPGEISATQNAVAKRKARPTAPVAPAISPEAFGTPDDPVKWKSRLTDDGWDALMRDPEGVIERIQDRLYRNGYDPDAKPELWSGFRMPEWASARRTGGAGNHHLALAEEVGNRMAESGESVDDAVSHVVGTHFPKLESRTDAAGTRGAADAWLLNRTGNEQHGPDWRPTETVPEDFYAMVRARGRDSDRPKVYGDIGSPAPIGLDSARQGATLHPNIHIRHTDSGDWVVKGRAGKRAAVQNEATASQLARFAGVAVPEVHAAKLHGQDVAAVRRVDGTPLSKMSPDERRAALAKVPREDVARHALFDYLIGNSDPNHGNYLVAPDGKLVAIDKEQSLNHGTIRTGATFRVPFFLADAQPPGKTASEFAFDRKAVAHMIDAGRRMAAELSRGGNRTAAAGVLRRLNVLRSLANRDTVTANNIVEAGANLDRVKPAPFITRLRSNWGL